MWRYCLLYQLWNSFLSDANFCLSYEKVNWWKIANNIRKTATLFDKRYLLVFILKIFSSCLRNIVQKYNIKWYVSIGSLLLRVAVLVNKEQRSMLWHLSRNLSRSSFSGRILPILDTLPHLLLLTLPTSVYVKFYELDPHSRDLACLLARAYPFYSLPLCDISNALRKHGNYR